jgi:UDP-N-acetylglucosamine--dolichyl-phosphate N-acetylglucosaminephosphotransferase
MEILLLSCFVISFVVTLLTAPYWIRIAHKTGICGPDVHKKDKRKVAELGGIIVVFGFLLGVLFYVALDTFYLERFDATNLERDIQILASLVTILIIAIIGIVDDILGWKIGLRQTEKPFLVLLATVPMIVVNAGHSITSLPFVGVVDLGIIYALVLVPIAITGAANGFNMIAGYNGLETGMGIIILSFLSYVAWLQNLGWVAIMGGCMVSALIAFYFYNKTPAKIFPGDTLTYSVGALIAIIAISANLEKLALIIFIPYFIELILKLRGRLQKESFAKLNKDNTLSVKEGIYGLEHLVIHIRTKLGLKTYERDVVSNLYLIQFVFIILGSLTLI